MFTISLHFAPSFKIIPLVRDVGTKTEASYAVVFEESSQADVRESYKTHVGQTRASEPSGAQISAFVPGPFMWWEGTQEATEAFRYQSIA